MTMEKVKLPNWDKLNLSQMETQGTFWDSQEIDNLNETIVKTTMELRKCNLQISQVDRKRLEKELEYKRNYRRAYLDVKDFKTETQRRFLAEISVEEIEMELFGLREIIDELQRYAFTLKNELDSLKTIGHNLRQEMRL